LENISRIREKKEDKQVKLIVEAIACSFKKENDGGSSEEDTTIFNKGDPSKGGTSKKNGNVTHTTFFLWVDITLLKDFV
jgi:hypothetical protein